MGDDLQPVHLENDFEFVSDLARYAEGILSETAIRKKYRLFDDATWEKLGSDDALVEKIELEKVRRVRDGSSKREKAQLLVVKAPDVLSGILLDGSANARHRIDASKVLNDFAANGPEGVPAADRFQITIVLNGDVERIDKPIAISPDDVDPNDIADQAGRRRLPGRNRSPNKGSDDGEPV